MEDQMRKWSVAEIEKLNRKIKSIKKIKEGKSKYFPKKIDFVNNRTRTSPATSITDNSNSDADQPHWRKASSSEGEDIGISKCKKRS